MSNITKHKVFISYHDADRKHKDRFVSNMGDSIIDESVQVDDIDDTNIKVETIRQRIRDKFIRDATVTIVLIGPCTWQRKHVDWEIGSSLRETDLNSRCGLLGILLPHHPIALTRKHNPRLIPPRLADNAVNDDPYAQIYYWSNQPSEIRNWIYKAFERRKGTPPNNKREQFQNNRSGDCAKGWQS